MTKGGEELAAKQLFSICREERKSLPKGEQHTRENIGEGTAGEMKRRKKTI